MSYRANERFADPARTTPELWRLPAAAAVTVAGAIGLQAILIAVVTSFGGQSAGSFVIAALDGRLNTPGGLLLVLASFGAFALGLGFAMYALHQRSLRSLFGEIQGLGADFLRVCVAMSMVLTGLSVLLPTGLSPEPNPSMTTGLWIMLLPLSLSAVLIQSGTEELFFRGYLQQQLTARFNAPLVALVVPSVLFGLGHGAADAGSNAWLFMVWAALFGLAAADLTARTGSLGAAMGFHFTNNAFAFLLVTPIGNSSALALFLLPISLDDPAIQSMWVAELGTLVCTWLAARVALRV